MDAAELILGLDVGTTATKAALFDLARPQRALAVARRASPSDTPRPGWSETDPERVLDAVLSSAAEVVEQAGGAPILALGISATACGAWLCDRHGELLRAPIMWNDARALPIVEEWSRDGTLERVHAVSGNVPYPGYTLPLLRWLAEHEPSTLGRSHGLLMCKDWLRLKLTGEWLSEESDASYVPFDIERRAWSPELFDLCGVAEHASLLPELAPPDHTAPLLAEMAARIGLSPDTRVALGATDIVAGLVGGGAIAAGQAVCILGTSAVTSEVTDVPEFEPRGIGIMAAAPLGRWARTMVNTSGSETLDWAARLLHDGDVGALLADAATARVGSDGLTLVPYLSGAGVVSPFADPAARGTLAGLRSHHGRSDVARAAVEGLAFAVADCCDALPVAIEDVMVTGGAARSDLLAQTIADATGRAVRRPEGEELGARGAALLAAWAAGLLGDDELERAVRDLPIAQSFEPRPERVEAARARYRRASDATRALWSGW